MTRQSEPLTWRYKLPLIIPAARQALGAPSGEQLCPLTSLHFSCFKGFSPHPNLKFPCLVDPRSFLFPPSRPGTSGSPWPEHWEEGENIKFHHPPPAFYSQCSGTLLIFIFSSQSIFNMELKHTPRRHL